MGAIRQLKFARKGAVDSTPADSASYAMLRMAPALVQEFKARDPCVHRRPRGPEKRIGKNE